MALFRFDFDAATRRNVAAGASERLLMFMEELSDSASSQPLPSLYPMGRAFLVKCLGPLGGPDSETLMREARRSRSRILLIDTTHAEYADSDGLRWLMALREAAAENTLELRIVVREGSNIYRNLLLLRAGLLLYGSVQTALHNAPHTLSPPVLPARKEAAFVG